MGGANISYQCGECLNRRDRYCDQASEICMWRAGMSDSQELMDPDTERSTSLASGEAVSSGKTDAAGNVGVQIDAGEPTGAISKYERNAPSDEGRQLAFGQENKGALGFIGFRVNGVCSDMRWSENVAIMGLGENAESNCLLATAHQPSILDPHLLPA